jgi:uncharacterized membrane protein YfcA
MLFSAAVPLVAARSEGAVTFLGFTPEAWIFLVVSAVILGIAKTGIPALTVVPIALFAVALPTRESIAVVLVLFILGDVVAIFLYRAHADWATLRGLVPSVAVGIIAGAAVLVFVDDVGLRRLLGAIVLILAVIATRTWWLRYLRERRNTREGRLLPVTAPAVPGRIASWAYGMMSGWATMVANSAGPIMSLYLVSRGLNIQALLGTSAWFYLVVNLTKLPFSIGLGLLTVNGLLLNAVLAPVFILGAILGFLWAKKISQKVFDGLILILSAVAGVGLLIS